MFVYAVHSIVFSQLITVFRADTRIVETGAYYDGAALANGRRFHVFLPAWSRAIKSLGLSENAGTANDGPLICTKRCI